MSTQNPLGLPRVINAAGKLTALGASAVHPEVAAAIAEGAQQYVLMDQLHEAAGRFLAQVSGAEAGFVTSCSAAGIAIGVAAAVTGGDPVQVEKVPFVDTPRRKVVIQRGHSVSFGAQILQMIQLGGGVPVEVGSVNKTELYHLEGNLTDDVAAVLFVVSHHTVSSGMLPLETVVAAAHQRGIPVIVDAAAEGDLTKYIRAGADLVIYSGHKAFGAPTSGIVVGRRELVAACAAQNKGIGRTMKIGKESILGLIKALQLYGQDGDPGRWRERVDRLAAAIGEWPGVQLDVRVEAGRGIPRLCLAFNPVEAGLTAAEFVAQLQAGDPVIMTRNHLLEHNIVQIDPRPLREDEIDLVAERVRAVLARYVRRAV